MTRIINTQFHPLADDFVSKYQSSTVTEVTQAVESNSIVVVGMLHNPYVKRARKALKKEGIEFKYLEYGSYFSGWKPRLMIKIWSGWPTFPQVFVDGKLLGGAQELVESLDTGEFHKLVAKIES
jgi:glutaredoxin-related protein